jgi:hypothetical protein
MVIGASILGVGKLRGTSRTLRWRLIGVVAQAVELLVAGVRRCFLIGIRSGAAKLPTIALILAKLPTIALILAKLPRVRDSARVWLMLPENGRGGSAEVGWSADGAALVMVSAVGGSVSGGIGRAVVGT